MRWREGGFTLTEVLVASLIASVVTGGTVVAVTTATRISRRQSSAAMAQASALAQQTAERFRNMIACDSPWFDPATCAPTPAGMPTAWTEDPLPSGGGTETIIDAGAKRCYRVAPSDCDGVDGADDCFVVEVKVCWSQTPCPC